MKPRRRKMTPGAFGMGGGTVNGFVNQGVGSLEWVSKNRTSRDPYSSMPCNEF